jgi:hypothetical protein
MNSKQRKNHNRRQKLAYDKIHRKANEKARKAGLMLCYDSDVPYFLYLHKNCYNIKFLYLDNLAIAKGSLFDLLLVIDRYWNLKVFL